MSARGQCLCSPSGQAQAECVVEQMRNLASDLVRDHWRKTSRERRAIRTITATVPQEPAWHPAQDVDVRDLIESLPPRLRSAFLLHYYAGFAVKEVAMLLGRPEGTVKADLHHARAKLKAAVGEAS